MENNSISILLGLSRINLGELRSLLVPVAYVFRCTSAHAAKVTFASTPVDKATPSVSEPRYPRSPLSSPGASPQSTP